MKYNVKKENHVEEIKRENKDQLKEFYNQDALYVFDTCFFSNICRTCGEQFKTIIDVMEELKNNIFISSIVEDEFQFGKYYDENEKIDKQLLNIKNQTIKELNSAKNKLIPNIHDAETAIKELMSETEKVFDRKIIDSKYKKIFDDYHNNYSQRNYLYGFYKDLRKNGQVLPNLTPEQRIEYLEEFENTLFKNSSDIGAVVIPSRSDFFESIKTGGKTGTSKYNDFYIFKELIILSIKMKKNIVFVSDDLKDCFEEHVDKENKIKSSYYKKELRDWFKNETHFEILGIMGEEFTVYMPKILGIEIDAKLEEKLHKEIIRKSAMNNIDNLISDLQIQALKRLVGQNIISTLDTSGITDQFRSTLSALDTSGITDQFRSTLSALDASAFTDQLKGIQSGIENSEVQTLKDQNKQSQSKIDKIRKSTVISANNEDKNDITNNDSNENDEVEDGDKDD